MYDVGNVVDLIRAMEAELDADVRDRIREEFNSEEILTILEQGANNQEQTEDAAKEDGAPAEVESDEGVDKN